MHMGESRGSRLARPFATLEDGTTDGAISASGTVMGSYLHGLFASADLRRALLHRIVVAATGCDYPPELVPASDEMAAEPARPYSVVRLIAPSRPVIVRSAYTPRDSYTWSPLR